MSVLVVAAHPDDEVLGCGATIARHAAAGDHVVIAIMAEGITSRVGSEEDRAAVEALQATSREVAEYLGAVDHVTFGLPDNRLDTVPLLELVHRVEELIDRCGPSVIYTHHPGDLNIDHEVVSRAVVTATRPLHDQPVRRLYAFEVPSSTEWAFHQRLAFQARVFNDVTGFVERKVEAMRMYEGEVRAFPHPRSPEALEAIARRWGSVAGCDAAEAFELLREIR